MSVSKHYQPAVCPDCHELTVPHATVGQTCPAVLAKAKRLVKAAQGGDSDAIGRLIKGVGVDRALTLMNPNLSGGGHCD